MAEKFLYQPCFVVGRNYQVRPKRLTWIDPYWRDPQCKVHYDEDVFFSEEEALRDALGRARRRRDELTDIIGCLQSRADAMEDNAIYELAHIDSLADCPGSHSDDSGGDAPLSTKRPLRTKVWDELAHAR